MMSGVYVPVSFSNHFFLPPPRPYHQKKLHSLQVTNRVRFALAGPFFFLIPVFFLLAHRKFDISAPPRHVFLAAYFFKATITITITSLLVPFSFFSRLRQI
eukprot:TRINITY_DN16092_c0_g1_i1.p1 TRINITY_DN16092_c0_g1~~TRINITY_DN16092_c0_g1_i1.p1  ORF type:complete len:101 (+),score=1.20 TRINITY_DN16092_c0_g1_i1:67-369(+)